jgi:tetratricopeptide (TPR) repeat protein
LDLTRLNYADQLRASACYQQTADLTCVTCHGNHDVPPAGPERVAYYRDRCLACHANGKPGQQTCGLPEDQRRESSPDDACSTCHMPRADSYKAHQPFVNHRVAVHDPDQKPGRRPEAKPQMEALDDMSHLPAAEQERLTGIGSLLLSWIPTRSRPEQFALRDNAGVILEELKEAGSEDPGLNAALALIYRARGQLQRAHEAATSALAAKPGLALAERISMLRLLIDLEMGDRRWPAAEKRLAELLELRRNVQEHILRSICAREEGRQADAVAAVEAALAMSPHRAGVHANAAEIYQWAGQEERASHHRRMSDRLESARVRNR